MFKQNNSDFGLKKDLFTPEFIFVMIDDMQTKQSVTKRFYSMK